MLLALLLAATPAQPVCIAMRPERCLLACEKGSDAACGGLLGLATEDLLPKDVHPRLFARLKTLCGTYGGRRCFAEGLAHLFGIGTPKDSALAAKRFSTACEAGSPMGCANLAVRYVRGDGIEKDPLLARRLALDACETSPGEPCLNAAEMVGTGVGAAPDAKAGLELLEKTCATYLPACGRMANVLLAEVWAPLDVARAAEVGERGCSKGDGASCEALARASLGGVGWKGDSEKTLRAFEKGCALGRPVSCYNLSVLHGEGSEQPDPVKAAAYALKGCDLGSHSACNSRAAFLLSGRGTRKDPKTARTVLQRSCANGGTRSCYTYAITLFHGLGGKADKAEAQRLLKQTCVAGLDQACDEERRLFSQ